MHAVTNTQYRASQIKNVPIGLGAVFLIDAGRSPRQNNAFRVECFDGIQGDVGRFNLAVDMLLANPAGNKLVILRTEVNDQYHGNPLINE